VNLSVWTVTRLMEPNCKSSLLRVIVISSQAGTYDP
jgi:hypothetical protein